MERSRGFTLIELMVVVGIVAVLAALAVRSYSRYALRAHRTEAHRLLMTMAHAEERWYATHNRYTDDLGKLGFAEPAVSEHGYYQAGLRLSDDDDQGYIAIAIPTGRQASDVCGDLSIDNAGHKTPARTDVAAHANGACW